MSSNTSYINRVGSGLVTLDDGLRTIATAGHNHAVQLANTSQCVTTAVNVYSSPSMSGQFAHGMSNAKAAIGRSRAILGSTDPIPQDAVVRTTIHANVLLSAKPDKYESWKVDVGAWKRVGMVHRMNWDEQVHFPPFLQLWCTNQQSVYRHMAPDGESSVPVLGT
jgi:hypothetical protein